jgi:hypothetical protein
LDKITIVVPYNLKKSHIEFQKNKYVYHFNTNNKDNDERDYLQSKLKEYVKNSWN